MNGWGKDLAYALDRWLTTQPEYNEQCCGMCNDRAISSVEIPGFEGWIVYNYCADHLGWNPEQNRKGVYSD